MAPDRRVTKPPAIPVRDWLGRFLRAAKAERLKPSYDGLVRLSAHLTIVGDSSDAEAQNLFWPLKALFFKEQRIGRWAAAMEVLPTTRDGMLRVLNCVQAYRTRVAGAEQFEKALFKLDEVLSVVVQVDDHIGYIDATKELRRIGAVFHPNTFASTCKRLRGTMGELAEMQVRHAVNTSKKITVVRV